MICLEHWILLFLLLASVVYQIHAFQIKNTSIVPNNLVQVGSTVRLSCQTDAYYEYCTWSHKTRICTFEWKRSGTVEQTECHNGTCHLFLALFTGKHPAYCMMMDHTGQVKKCASDKANVMCEMHLAPSDRQLCLDKTIATPSITFNSSTEITMQV